jgi:serine/threonine protein kinase
MKKGGRILGTGSFGCVSDIQFACETQIPNKYNIFKPFVSKIILIPKLNKNTNSNLNNSSVNLSNLYIKNNSNNNSLSNISSINHYNNTNKSIKSNLNNNTIISNNNIESSVIYHNNNNNFGSVVFHNNNNQNYGSVVFHNNNHSQKHKKQKSHFEGIQFSQNIRLITEDNNSFNSNELKSYTQLYDISNLRNEIENSLLILSKINNDLIFKHFVPIIHFCKFNINQDIVNNPDYQFCVKNFIEKNFGILKPNLNFDSIFKQYKRKILSQYQEIILFSSFAGNNLKILSKNSNFFLQITHINNLLIGTKLLHDIQLIHHDIKLDNISIHNNNILLLDFGESIICNRFIKKNNKLIADILRLSSTDTNLRIKSIIKNIIHNFVFGTPSYFPPEFIIFLLAQSYLESKIININILLNQLKPFFKLNNKLNKNLESIILANIDFIKNILSSKNNIIQFILNYFQNIESNLYKYDSYCIGMSILKLSKKNKIFNNHNIYSLIFNMMNPKIDERYTINQSIQFLESIK